MSFCLTDLFPKLSQPWNMCLTDTCWQNPVDKVLRKAPLDYISVPAFTVYFFLLSYFTFTCIFRKFITKFYNISKIKSSISFFLPLEYYFFSFSSFLSYCFSSSSCPVTIIVIFFFLHHSHKLYLSTNAMWISLLPLCHPNYLIKIRVVKYILQITEL